MSKRKGKQKHKKQKLFNAKDFALVLTAVGVFLSGLADLVALVMQLIN